MPSKKNAMWKITCWVCKQSVEQSNTALASEVHPFRIDIWANTHCRHERELGNVDYQRICQSCIRKSLSLGYFDFKSEIPQPVARSMISDAVNSRLDGVLDGITGATMVTPRITWLSVSDLMKYGSVGLKESGAWLMEFRLPHRNVNFCHLCFSNKLRRHPSPIMLERIEPELVGGFCCATILRFLVRRATSVWCIYRFGAAGWRYNFREALVGTASLVAGYACGSLFDRLTPSIVDEFISPPYSSSKIIAGACYIVCNNVASALVGGMAGMWMRIWLNQNEKRLRAPLGFLTL